VQNIVLNHPIPEEPTPCPTRDVPVPICCGDEDVVVEKQVDLENESSAHAFLVMMMMEYSKDLIPTNSLFSTGFSFQDEIFRLGLYFIYCCIYIIQGFRRILYTFIRYVVLHQDIPLGDDGTRDPLDQRLTL
jgi:hypothetical protein